MCWAGWQLLLTTAMHVSQLSPLSTIHMALCVFTFCVPRYKVMIFCIRPLLGYWHFSKNLKAVIFGHW
jgi:hypothetical protein